MERIDSLPSVDEPNPSANTKGAKHDKGPKYENLIPKLNFNRLVKEIQGDVTGKESIRWSKEAMEALQEAAENYCMEIFQDANMISLNANRVTLTENDMRLATLIRQRPAL